MEAKSFSNALEGEVSANVLEVPKIIVHSIPVPLFDQVFPAIMMEEQAKDSVLGLVLQYLLMGKKTKGLVKAKPTSKAVSKCLLRFERLAFKQGVIHCLCI